MCPDKVPPKPQKKIKPVEPATKKNKLPPPDYGKRTGAVEPKKPLEPSE